MNLTLQQRADLYRKSFTKFQPISVVETPDGKQRLEAIWFMGNDYRVKSGYYGGYPAGYLPRIMSMFPDAKSILHLFSGKVEKTRPGEITFDINPERKPDLVGNAEWLSSMFSCAECGKYYSEECVHPKGFDLILADPPYSNSDADRYGTIMIRRNKVVHECLKVLRPGGFLVWLDQVFPLHKKIESPLVGTIYVREEFPDLEYAGEIGMIKSTNHRVRAVFIFQKKG
jgi:hypothetical protein